MLASSHAATVGRLNRGSRPNSTPHPGQAGGLLVASSNAGGRAPAGGLSRRGMRRPSTHGPLAAAAAPAPADAAFSTADPPAVLDAATAEKNQIQKMLDR
jgi:hypothetical protein